MAAYAALVSVLQTIEQIEHHPRPPISLDKTQLQSLSEKITYLQEFLEGESQFVGYSKDADPLEMRIADAAYGVEDVIESHVMEVIDFRSLPQSTAGEKFSLFNFCTCFRRPRKAETKHEVESPSEEFCRSLHKVIEDMDLIKKEVMEIKEKAGVRDQLMRNTMKADSLRSSAGQNSTMVGFDDELVEVMDKLTRGRSDGQIIPIIGMGGSGKTTIARTIYQHQVVVQHFDFRAWTTISQDYNLKEILLELLQEGGTGGDLSEIIEHELGEKLYKRLCGRRYMIIMDDIWNTEAWDQLARFFPDNKNGSRIVLTTRISNFESTGSYVLKMRFLDKDTSWSLFSEIVFGEEVCPLDLEEIGKKIVDNCGGLPLSIVVVGGLLSKSNDIREHWKSEAQNLNSFVNSGDDESCLKILHMSYNQLLVYLKPCFLYMGTFPEDKKISVSELIKLWLGEGFLKPISGRSLKEAANEYLHELINRNLVIAHELGSIGNVKYCKIHDLLRDLCLRLAEKERFFNVIRRCSPYVSLDTRTRRIVILEHPSQNDDCSSLQDMSPARSLMWDSEEVPLLRNFGFLRVMSCALLKYKYFPEDMSEIVNLRCLVSKDCSIFSSSFHSFWNLQTLFIQQFKDSGAPIEIWSMPQLRHLKTFSAFNLADPPSGRNDMVLRNLHTLGGVIWDFKCSVEVIIRIPNIKKLKVQYLWAEDKVVIDYIVYYFFHLHKLESFSFNQLSVSGADHLQHLNFPQSLRKLSLSNVDWENKLEKVGSLPHLEKFKLRHGYFRGGKWETVEGQFRSLKFLEIERPRNLRFWKTESSHFPCLEHLVLKNVEELEEIPSEIGEIPTLESIRLWYCSDSVCESAKKILEEQEDLYGEVTLQVLVHGKGWAS